MRRIPQPAWKPRVSYTGHNLKGLGAPQSTTSALESTVGITGQGGATGAVHGAAAGASIGTAIVPGIGTAIGAVVGALAGALIHSSKFPDWLAADTQIIAQMNQLPAGTRGRDLSLQTLLYMYDAVVVTGALYSYVNPAPSHSPSDMQSEFNWIMAWMKTIIQAMNQAPIGAPVNLSIPTGNGVTFTMNFTNPGTADSNSVAQTVMIPAYIAWCTHNNATDVQNCNTDAAKPIVQLVLTLMTDYQIGQNPPPAAQASVATTPPPAIVTPDNQAAVTVQQSSMPAPTMSQSTPPPQVIYEQAPAAAPATSDNTMLYIGAGLAAVLILTRNKKK